MQFLARNNMGLFAPERVGQFNWIVHQVMITGYNNNGTFSYFDPAAGTYSNLPYSAFSDLVEIISKKIELYI